MIRDLVVSPFLPFAVSRATQRGNLQSFRAGNDPVTFFLPKLFVWAFA